MLVVVDLITLSVLLLLVDSYGLFYKQMNVQLLFAFLILISVPSIIFLS